MSKLYQEENSYLFTTLPRPRKNRRKSIPYWFRRYRYQIYRQTRNLKGNPVTLARGLAIGVFAGCFPFFGLQSLIGVLLATIFRGSKVAAIGGTWISNPLTYLPIFVFNFKVGKFFLGVDSISSQEVDFESLSSFMELGYIFAIVLLVGCLIVGTVLAVISYFVGLSLFKRLRRNQSTLPRKISQRKQHTTIKK
jgi:uncharacterized protein (DUF2062 family)